MSATIGTGRAFDEIDGNGHRSLAVVKADDGFVYVIVVDGRESLRFIATDEMAKLIAKALIEASS